MANGDISMKEFNNEKEFLYSLAEPFFTKTYKLPDGQIKFEPNLRDQRLVTSVRVLEDEMWSTDFKKVYFL